MDWIPDALKTLLPADAILVNWLGITLCVIFLLTLIQALQKGSPWTLRRRRLAAMLLKTLGFAVLALMTYQAGSFSYERFNQVFASFTNGGGLSNAAWIPWYQMYGPTLTQRDLLVNQQVQLTHTETLVPDAPGGKTMYYDVTEELPVTGNTITGFTGYVTINPADPKHMEETFHGYALTARYEYEISNPAGEETNATFSFPIDANRLYRDVHVSVNGEEFSSIEVHPGSLDWKYPMKPGQVDQVAVEYATWGTDGYTYQFDNPRVITNFKLSLAMETNSY